MKSTQTISVISITIFMLALALMGGVAQAQYTIPVWTDTGLVQNGTFEVNPLTNGWVNSSGRYYWPVGGNPGSAARLSKVYSTDPEALLHQDITGLTAGALYKVTADTDFWGTDSRSDDVHVWLNVYDSEGTLLARAQRDGGNGWLTLTAAFTAPSNGKIRIQLTGQNYWWEAEVYWDNVILYISTGQVAINTINTLISQLNSLITTAKSMSIETAYAQSVIQVATKFQPFIQADLNTGSSWGMQNIASLETELQKQIDSLADQIQNGRNSYLIVPKPMMTNLTIQDGTFYSGTTPVVMQGPHGWLWEIYNDRNIFGKLGYNCFRISLEPYSIYDSTGYLKSTLAAEGIWTALNQNLTAAKVSNLYVSTHIFDLAQIWSCVARRGSVDIASYRAELQNLASTLYANIAPGQINHHIVAVECEGPSFPYESTRHQAAYHSWLESEYGTIANYNTICQTSFSSFSQVTFPTSTETNLARRYDRQMFLNRITADELQYAADLIHSYDPNVVISGYPSYLQLDNAANHTTYNQNPEMMMETYGICDGDTWGSYFTSTYAMSTIDWLCMFRDQMNALGIGTPQADSEFHLINSRTSYADGWVSGISLQGYIHGMSLSYLWTWVHNDTVDSALLLDAAVCVDASKSALDLRRLAEPLHAFQKASPDVVFLYSHTSRSLQTYFDQMFRCYEGLFFEGLKLGFITEKQIVNGDLSSHKLLIIPSAQYVPNAVVTKIQEFLNNGGSVCLVGNCLAYTERGVPRTTPLSSPRLYQYSEFSNADAARTSLLPYVSALNLLPPVSVQVSGSSSRVVEWRYAKSLRGNDCYLYLLNMGKTPVTVNLSIDGVDLVAGKVVSSTLTLNSLDRKIIKFPNPNIIMGDANGDGMVDVGDLGILAANYSGSGKTWQQGDFNGDGVVDVGDLGILAANYGTSNFSKDYAQALGMTINTKDANDNELLVDSTCGVLGVPLVIGLMLMGLMLIKLKE
jgi:hypothetical protein